MITLHQSWLPYTGYVLLLVLMFWLFLVIQQGCRSFGSFGSVKPCETLLKGAIEIMFFIIIIIVIIIFGKKRKDVNIQLFF